VKLTIHFHLVEAKNAWNYTSTPPYVFMARCLTKQAISLYDGYLLKNMRNFNLVVGAQEFGRCMDFAHSRQKLSRCYMLLYP
jgi:hypothetical protein